MKDVQLSMMDVLGRQVQQRWQHLGIMNSKMSGGREGCSNVLDAIWGMSSAFSIVIVGVLLHRWRDLLI